MSSSKTDTSDDNINWLLTLVVKNCTTADKLSLEMCHGFLTLNILVFVYWYLWIQVQIYIFHFMVNSFLNIGVGHNFFKPGTRGYEINNALVGWATKNYKVLIEK